MVCYALLTGIAQKPRNLRYERVRDSRRRMSRLILLALLAPFSHHSRRLGDSFALCLWSADDARADVISNDWNGGATG